MIAIERWRPFGSVARWDSEVNRLFDSFFGKPTATSNGDRVWAPALDMYETKDEIVLNFELPGVREKDVTLSITGFGHARIAAVHRLSPSMLSAWTERGRDRLPSSRTRFPPALNTPFAPLRITQWMASSSAVSDNAFTSASYSDCCAMRIDQSYLTLGSIVGTSCRPANTRIFRSPTRSKAGAGAATHLGCVVLNTFMGTDITHVPYRGTGPAMQDLVASRIDFLCEAVSTAKPHIDGGTIASLGFLDWPFGDSFMPAPLGGTLARIFPKDE